jgi:hypothetical protein
MQSLLTVKGKRKNTIVLDSYRYLTKYELMSAVGSLNEAGLFCCWLDRLPSVLLALKSR